jgi:hypothetical protein
METFLTQLEASKLLGIGKNELLNRMHEGQYQWREFPSERLRGRTVKRIVLASLPWEQQQAYRLTHPLPAAKLPSPSAMVPAPQPAVPQQLDLPIRTQGDRLHFLPAPLRDYVRKWLDILGPSDVLHWNGLWKEKFYNKVFQVAGRDRGPPQQFVITSKTRLIEYLAAAHHVSVRKIYARRDEVRAWARYMDDCHAKGLDPDQGKLAAIFPASASDSKERLKRRADHTVSKSITPEMQQFLMGKFSTGSEPGDDGGRTTLTAAMGEIETMRLYAERRGEDPDALGIKVPSLSAVRRFYRWHYSHGKNEPGVNDPAIIWAQEGSKRFKEIVAPCTPRAYDFHSNDWWVGDHHLADLNVYLANEPRQVFRPWLTFWLDIRSRWPVSFVLCMVPSATSVLKAWKEAILRTRMAPLDADGDNGKDYLSIVVNGESARGSTALDGRQIGRIEAFGTRYHHTLPSGTNQGTGERECHAQSKIVERFFGNLRTFDRPLRGACGSDPTDKPEKLTAELFLHAEAAEKWHALPEGGRPPFASPTLFSEVEYMELLENFLLTCYGTRRHRGEGMDCSPLEAFTRYAPIDDEMERRRLTADQVASLMLNPPQKAVVKNTAVRVQISGRTLTYRHEAFLWLTGKQMTVEVDPSDPDSAFVSFDGRFVCRALRVPDVAYGAAREVIAREARLKHHTATFTKDRLKQLSAATFLPTAQELAAMRAELHGEGHGLPHAASLDRGRKRLEAETQAAEAQADPGPAVDPAQFIAGTPDTDSKAPSLYDVKDCTVEEG